jgi:hypothetical protein
MTLAGVDIIFDDGSTRFAMWKNVIVQVRRGKLTASALDLMMASWRSRQQRSPRQIFGVFVITEGAELPAADARKRQIEVLTEVGASGRLHAAVVLEGSGVLADLRRAVVASLGGNRVDVYKTSEEAARSLSELAGAPSEAEILAVVRAARG